MNKIQPEVEAKNIEGFLRDTFQKTGFSKSVIGVSGGVDSATSLVLAVKTLGVENVYPLLLPYGALSTQGTLDAMEQIQALGIQRSNIIRIDIQPTVDALAKNVSPDEARKGNIMARVRMICLFDQAKKYKALVVGTENKTEHHLGYFTRFGDEASDIEPLLHLWKTQIYELATYLGVIKTILEKAPTASLWSGQTDEKEFGFTYEQADQILSELIDSKKTTDELLSMGLDEQISKAVMSRVRSNEFKKLVPYRLTDY